MRVNQNNIDWKTLTAEDEYDIALERMFEIVHAEQGTPEADECDILLPLIVAYEDIHYPIPAPDLTEEHK